MLSILILTATWPNVQEAALGARLDPTADFRFPLCPQVVNIKLAPYLAKGDGFTDDTTAIQQALLDMMGKHKVLYFPNGTYLVSKTLQWRNKNSDGGNAYGFNWIQGQNTLKTVIRLKDGSFTDTGKPQSIMWCGGFGSADWFSNYVEGMTFDVGKNNAGAIGLQFYSNNVGAVRNLLITSQDGKGHTGLDLGHRDMNGPLLVKNVEVRGYQTGIKSALAVNSQTLESITLSGQSEFGFDNHGQSIAINDLVSRNAVPAVRTYGTLSLLNATLQGEGSAKNFPAIVNYNGGRTAFRDVNTSGYSRAVADVTTPDYWSVFRISGPDKPGSQGPIVREYFSHNPTRLFPGPKASLRLPIEETPVAGWEDPKSWAVVDAFGADPTGVKDSSAAIQNAIDSGATTVFFPGFYATSKSVIVRGKVRRLLGVGAWVDYKQQAKPCFVISNNAEPVVFIEHFFGLSGIDVQTDRTVVLRSLATAIARSGKGKLFLEDVTTDDLRNTPGQKLWARQLNVENEGTHFTNDGASAWILGFKTERGGTLALTKSGGQTEIYGTFSYTTTAGKLAPMFVTENASIFAFFSEICFNGDPFAVLASETRGQTTKVFKRGEGHTIPYIAGPGH